MCPAELMFRKKLRTKLPELRENVNLDEEMRDKDREKKEKMKGYAEKRRNAKESNLSEGDKVLLRQQRTNKWTTAFEIQPYQVIDKHGNSVLVESPQGVQYKRNSTHVKAFQEKENGPEEIEMSATVPEIPPRREKHRLQGKHHRKVIVMDECQVETLTKQQKLCQSNPQDLCVPDMRQKDMEI
ncbi:Hypothetical predicted protein, partial [Paramuricea clavata]